MNPSEDIVVAEIATLLKTYKPSLSTTELIKNTPIVLLVGVSGAGKDTIKHKLLETGDYHEFVSHTTRKPRENHGIMEQEGVEYHFISLEESKKMLEQGEYIEAKMYGDKVYGTSVAELKQASSDGKIALNDIEVQGVAEYRVISDKVKAIFIVPPTYEEWRRRLLYRYGEGGADPEDIQKRTQIAIEELEHALEVDYYHFIINDVLDRAVFVINEIAHGEDASAAKDDWARGQAVKLLEEIRQNATQ
jgi:guanylate kinase